MHALVVVLGDLGRSPRMLAHAGSLLTAGYVVHLVGYERTPLPSILMSDGDVHVHALPDRGSQPGRGIIAALATSVRGMRLAIGLTRALVFATPRPEVIVAQTPPALPTLPICMLVARLRRATLVVDWHNLGWTLLGLRFGESHLLVRATKRVEAWAIRRSVVHLAVSEALAQRLETAGASKAHALHDAPSRVRPFPSTGKSVPRDRLVVVAPMGWTRDDDLPLLERAISALSERQEPAPDAKPIELIVSGNGPLRAEWLARLEAMGDSRTEVRALDVPADAYPSLLASAHVGLSIHRSSSGLDIPMKVVELLAAGVPVLALDDASPLTEIAPPGSGVLTYRTADELAGLLSAMLVADDRGPTVLTRLEEETRNRRAVRWDDSWHEIVHPLLSGIGKPR